MAALKGPGNFLWPRVDTPESAQAACRSGAAMAFFVAAATTVLAGLGAAGVAFAAKVGMDAWAFVDAGLFALFGWFMLGCSRIAAIAALVLFVAARISLIYSGVGAGSIFAIFVIIAFVGAVRGAFAHHRFQVEAQRSS